jgi:hypothetical protein
MEEEPEGRKRAHRRRGRSRRTCITVSSGKEERSSAWGVFLATAAVGAAIVFISLWAADPRGQPAKDWHDPWEYGQSQ